MRKIYLALATVFALVMVSCTGNKEVIQEVIDFETMSVDSTGYFNGSDMSGELSGSTYYTSLTQLSASIVNEFTPNAWGGNWSGASVSTLVDTVTAGWGNQFSTIAGSGADKSKTFAVVYSEALVVFPSDAYVYEPQSIKLTNSTYSYLYVKNGDAAFGMPAYSEGKYFKIIFTGKLDNVETGVVEFYLADFRDGKSYITRDWTNLDLTKLGVVNEINISFESNDTGDWGVNTPLYACIDNLLLHKSLAL